MPRVLPMVSGFLLFVALVVLPQEPDGKAKGKGGGKGGSKGGFTAKNLQLLDQATFPDALQSYVQALGPVDKGVCNYCHVADRSSDEKMQKAIARNMILMVREINARFPDGKQHVTCYTCHRGSTTPATAPERAIGKSKESAKGARRGPVLKAPPSSSQSRMSLLLRFIPSTWAVHTGTRVVQSMVGDGFLTLVPPRPLGSCENPRFLMPAVAQTAASTAIHTVRDSFCHYLLPFFAASNLTSG